MVVVVLIPWLLWGFSITTERLHDRNKSAWWLVVFYGTPAVLGQLARKPHGLPEQQARCSITSWLWPVLRSRSGDLSKSDSCAAPPGPTHMGPIRSCKLNGEAERQMQGGRGSDAGQLAALLLLHGAPCAATRKRQRPLKTKKSPMAIRPPGEVCNFGSMLRTMPPHEGSVQALKSSPRIQSRPQDMIPAAVIQRRPQPIFGMIARPHLMDFRQYSVLGQAHGYCGW